MAGPDVPAGPEVPRLAKLHPHELDDDQSALYRSIAQGPRAQGRQAFSLVDADGRLEGPFNAMLLSPRVGAALQELGAALRYGCSLPDRAREIAILLVAYHWTSAFEIHAHEAVGAGVGLDTALLADLRAGVTERLAGEEQLVAETVLHLIAGDLDDDAYRAAVDGLGPATVFDLSTLVGYYATLALQLRVFRVEPPVEGQVPAP